MGNVRILYVHGYKGTPNGTTYQNLESYIKNDPRLELYSFGWSFKNDTPYGVFIKLSQYVRENNIDLVIGNSMGGYFSAGLTSVPKILINPLLDIKYSILKHDNIKQFFELYNDKLWNEYAPMNTQPVEVYCGGKDTLLGTNATKLSKKLYPNTSWVNAYIIYDAEHKLTQEQIKQPIDSIYRIINLDYDLKTKYYA